MIYQSEDHFIHDRSWKNEIIEDLQSVALATYFPCSVAKKNITTHQFFYSFCCKEQFKNYHQFVSCLLLYTNSLKDHFGNIQSQQPLVVFFDKNLNRFFRKQPNQLVWDALAYAQTSDPTPWQKEKEATTSDEFFYFNDVQLCLNIVDSSVKYSRGVFDKNLMLIIHPKKNNDTRTIKMKTAS